MNPCGGGGGGGGGGASDIRRATGQTSQVKATRPPMSAWVLPLELAEVEVAATQGRSPARVEAGSSVFGPRASRSVLRAPVSAGGVVSSFTVAWAGQRPASPPAAPLLCAAASLLEVRSTRRRVDEPHRRQRRAQTTQHEREGAPPATNEVEARRLGLAARPHPTRGKSLNVRLTVRHTKHALDEGGTDRQRQTRPRNEQTSISYVLVCSVRPLACWFLRSEGASV